MHVVLYILQLSRAPGMAKPVKYNFSYLPYLITAVVCTYACQFN